MFDTPGGFARPDTPFQAAARSMLRGSAIHRIDSSNPNYRIGKTDRNTYYFSHDISPRQSPELPDT
jgi:hypothetical protein